MIRRLSLSVAKVAEIDFCWMLCQLSIYLTMKRTNLANRSFLKMKIAHIKCCAENVVRRLTGLISIVHVVEQESNGETGVWSKECERSGKKIGDGRRCDGCNKHRERDV